MTDDQRPTVRQIAETSKTGCLKHRYGTIQYEVVKYEGVEILISKDRLYNAIRVSAEFTHNPEIEKLAEKLGIKLRRFR